MSWHRIYLKSPDLQFLILTISLLSFTASFPQSDNTGKISGWVRNRSLQPLDQVEVRAVTSVGTYFYRLTYTNPDGSYELNNLPVGQYFLRVQNKSGYLNYYYHNTLEKSQATLIKLDAGQHIRNINFELDQGGFISGRIFDANGKPLTATTSIGFMDAQNYNSWGFINSNPDGSYISPALPAGTHIVKASALPAGYVMTYYNGVSSQDSAQAIRVAVGDTVKKINFYLQTGGAISGLVLSDTPDQKPIANAWIVVTNWENGEWSSECWSNSNGYYCAAGLRPGAYRVKIFSVDPSKYHTEYYQNAAQAEYATKVYVVNKDTTRNIKFFLDPVKRLTLANDFIEFCVSDRYPGTNLTLKINGGLPQTPLDDGKPILFGHPYPYTSFTTVWVDGKTTNFGSSEGLLLEAPYISNDYKSISRKWSYSGIQVKQKISLIASEWSEHKFEDTAQIQYIVTNTDQMPHQIGLRILLDTMLGKEDAAPIRTSNCTYVSRERDFYPPQIPNWWLAIEGYNYVTNFSVQGTLQGFGATSPDRFAIVNWSRIFQTQWEYTIDRDVIITKDSGVAMWWEPTTLQPGQTRTYVTFLGLGAMPPDVEPPYTQNHQPKKDATAVALNTPIQFEVLDDYMGVDSTSIALRVNGNAVLPQIAGTLNKYRVSYDPQNAFNYSDTISVEIDASDLAIRPNRMATERYKFYMIRDTLAPEIKQLYPWPNASHVPRDTSLSLVLFDRHSGLDTNSIAVYVNGRSINFDLQAKTNEALVRHHFVPPFRERDEVRVRIVARDRVRPPNVLDSLFTFVIMPDTLPPRVEFYSPLDRSQEIALDSSIVIRLVDDFSGIDRQSIQFSVNEQPVVPKIDGDSSRFIITYLPERGYRYNQQIKVRIEAHDLAKKANRMSPFEFSFETATDTLPPTIVSVTPAPEDTNVSPLPRFLIDIMDDRSGIDSSGIELWVNHTKVAFERTGHPLAYRIAYQPERPFDYLTWIPVRIEARDCSYPPNHMAPFDFKFRIMREKDRTPPRTERHQPARGAIGVDPASDVSFHVLDDQSGVDRSSIVLKINEQVVAPKIEGSPNDYLVTYQPPQPFWYGERVTIEIEAQDLAPDTVNIMPTDRYVITILRDTIPPALEWLAPGPPGSHQVPLEAEFRAQITDDLTGIDLESIEFAFRGQRERPVISGYGASCQLYFKPAVPMKYNEQVQVLLKVNDRATPPNRNSDTLFTFFTIEDHDPPYVLSCSPENEARGIDFNTDLAIQLNDDVAGVDVRSIVMTVENDTVQPDISGTPGSYTLRYHHPDGFRPGQEVNISIAAADRSDPPNRMPDYHFRFFILVILPNISIPSFTSDAQQLLVHRSATVVGRVRVDTAPVFDPIQIQLLDNQVVVMDTMVLIRNKDEELQFQRSLSFLSRDRHELVLRVDPRNFISESNEEDNVAAIAIDVAEGALIVRSNPFTPNGDGINDVVNFNFEELSIALPLLKLFDVSGRLVATLQQPQGYSLVWDGRDRFGNPAPPGAYLYLLYDRGQVIANGYVVLAR